MAAGFLYAYLLYKNDARFDDAKPIIKKIMFLSRFILVSILAFLLLSPFIKTLFNKIEKPIIIIAQDNSSSILFNKDSLFYQTTYQNKMEELVTNLSQNFEVKKYTFGQNLDGNKPNDFTEKITNLSNVFNEIESKFYNQNIGAVILASDGIYNQGTNPLYLSNLPPYTVYTLILGDTSIQRDIILKEVNHNKITFLKNQFPLEIFAVVNKSEGLKTQLKITHDNAIIFSKDYTISSNSSSITETILLEAKNIGTQHYKVEFSTIENEVSTTNNRKDIYIDVLDGKQNILILANSPHPDIKALKNSIESNENYKVTAKFITDFDGNLNPYSLVIVHQIPQNNNIIKQINASTTSAWYIIGNQSNEQDFNGLNLGISVINSKNNFNDILPKLNPQFPLFIISENTSKSIQNFPPLSGFFGNYQIKTNSYQLLNQKIGNVETDNPLLVFNEQENKKNAILFGEGIWRWRMQEFLINSNNDATNELINKTVQFLAVKDDKSKFRVILNKSILENEELIINAELYNDSYELINEPEVKIALVNAEDKKFNYVFNKTSKAYVLDAGILVSGIYNYIASTKLGEKIYTQKGQFQVLPLMLEANNSTADVQLMQNLAKKFGGHLFYSSMIDEINPTIEQNKNISSIIYEEHDIKDWIQIKWIFFVLILLLTLEWFLRKRNGAY
ncbi:MAG: hypothetical protein HYU68_05620 [Bacteroidetes bacterium]|nr:hypothetical protein [Bacteroidota bacterium]